MAAYLASHVIEWCSPLPVAVAVFFPYLKYWPISIHSNQQQRKGRWRTVYRSKPTDKQIRKKRKDDIGRLCQCPFPDLSLRLRSVYLFSVQGAALCCLSAVYVVGAWQAGKKCAPRHSLLYCQYLPLGVPKPARRTLHRV